MRIDGVDKNKGISPKQAAKKAAAGDFSAFLDTADEVEQTTATAPMMPMQAVNNLLFVQQTGAEDAQQHAKKQAVQHGSNLLNMLDKLRLSILSGTVSAQLAYDLAQRARQHALDVQDPELQNLIEEIETRALVELAKLDV